ncbi:hypothetical protein BOTBODRAFT_31119 [Botryobasidium botryosum FD-172 SS1]|uniref:DUF676 domain-containing protein n=1 Tax=Botryobasidium botryosum (strain FD-172 SS1) TaxID=930990 RepID=A0A067MMS8_BOTB1|nr:hypothetical protein BOTBODRAFT_31119 [Botryobasidium botryosum FD-172 SS1]
MISATFSVPLPVLNAFRRIGVIFSTLSFGASVQHPQPCLALPSDNGLHFPSTRRSRLADTRIPDDPVLASPPLRRHVLRGASDSITSFTFPAISLCSLVEWPTLGRTHPGASSEERKHPHSSSKPGQTAPSPPTPPRSLSYIEKLMASPALFDPVRKPRYPVVLCHGLYGYDVYGPSYFPKFQLHYWSHVLEVLRGKVGADVIVTAVPGTGSIEQRSNQLHGYLKENMRNREVNFLAHSMGGLDCRHLITHVQPKEYAPVSLTTVSTPHRGSPFMDWCKANIGIGAIREALANPHTPASVPYSLKAPLLRRLSTSSTSPASSPLISLLTSLPTSLTSFLLSILDSPAYSNLTTDYMNSYFNPNTPNVDSVRYFSVAGRTRKMGMFHPLWLPKFILDETEAAERARRGDVAVDADGEDGNDGLVSVRSAKWGEFLGIVDGCDHWDLRGTSGFSQWGAGRVQGKEGESENEKRGSSDGAREAGWLQANAGAAMEWVQDSVMSGNNSGSGTAGEKSDRRAAAVVDAGRKDTERAKEKERREAGVFTVEKFYMALSKKLYNEGF